MTPLEIRLIAYAILLGLYTWGVHTLDAHHYERLQAAENLAQASAYAAQQSQVIASLRTQEAATQAAEKQYETLKATADGLSQRLADSVSNYTALRRSLLPPTAATPARADAPRPGTGSDSELAGLVRQATEACLGDAAQLTGLQQWAATSSTVF